MLLGLILVVVGTYVLVFGFVKKINEWRYVSSLGEKKHSLPPGDMGWPLLGNTLSFFRAFSSKNNGPETLIYNLVERYGRTGIYKTHLFGSPTIIVSMPETCRKVLTDDERFIMGYPKSATKLTGNTFNSMPSWEQKRLRRLIADPINGHEELAMYIRYIEDVVINSLDEWSSISMNQAVEFLKELRRFTFKIITHIFLGSTTAESIFGLMEKHFTDFAVGLISAPINIPGFAFYKALKARTVLVKILQGVLDERRAKSTQFNDPNERRGIIDRLIKAEDENDQKLADEDIIDLLLIFLVAGHETSAHASMWAIIFLHDHPEMLQKAKEEQEEVLKKRPSTQTGLTLKDIKQMSYLHKVIDETFRRTTPAPLTFREAKVAANINGYLIPEGWKVITWMRGVHMDPEVYPNPKEFNPARWENNNSKAGSFLPFGLGSRICPGADLAKLEILIFLHYFLLNYKFEQINPRTPIVYFPAPRPTDNCLAKIMKVE